jgi:hypothetical protein
MGPWFDFNCVPFVERSFAAFLKNDQGSTNTSKPRTVMRSRLRCSLPRTKRYSPLS